MKVFKWLGNSILLLSSLTAYVHATVPARFPVTTLPGQLEPQRPVRPMQAQVKSTLGLLMIEDTVAHSQYLTTLTSTGDVVPGSMPQSLFGARAPGIGAKKPAVWYTHKANPQIKQIHQLLPAQAFRGFADEHGSAVGWSGGSFSPRNGRQVNPVLSEMAFTQFAQSGVGMSRKLSFTEQASDGRLREFQTVATKQAHLTLNPAIGKACRNEVIQGIAGKVCTLRTVRGQSAVANGGDLMFTVRAKMATPNARFKVAQAWHRLGESIPISEFSRSQSIEVFFVPPSKAQQQSWKVEHPNQKLANLIEAGFYSASRLSRGDRFNLQLLGAELKPAEQNVLARLSLLLIDDQATQQQYVTTLSGRSDQAIYGAAQLGPKGRSAIWYVENGFPPPLFPLTESHAAMPSSLFGGFADAQGQVSLDKMLSHPGQINPVFSAQAFDLLLRQPVGAQQQLTLEGHRSNGDKVSYRSHIVKSAALTLARPQGVACRAESVDGVAGQVCVLRTVAGTYQAQSGGDIRFGIRSKLALPSARFRVADRWHAIGESVPLADFAKSTAIEVFFVPPSADQKQTWLAGHPQQKLSSLVEAGFYSSRRKGAGDSFAISLLTQTLPSDSEAQLNLLLIDDQPSKQQYVTTLSGGQGQRIYGAFTPQNKTRPAIWYVQPAKAAQERNLALSAQQVSPAAFFKGFSDQNGQMSLSKDIRPGQLNPVLSELALSQLLQQPVGSAQKLQLEANGAGAVARYQATAVKSAALTLGEPDKNKQCRTALVEGVQGEICTLRTVIADSQATSGGDLRFTIKGDLKDARFRVGGDWYLFGTDLPVQLLNKAKEIEIFSTQSFLKHKMVLQVYSFSGQRQGDVLSIDLSHSYSEEVIESYGWWEGVGFEVNTYIYHVKEADGYIASSSRVNPCKGTLECYFAFAVSGYQGTSNYLTKDDFSVFILKSGGGTFASVDLLGYNFDSSRSNIIKMTPGDADKLSKGDGGTGWGFVHFEAKLKNDGKPENTSSNYPELRNVEIINMGLCSSKSDCERGIEERGKGKVASFYVMDSTPGPPEGNDLKLSNAEAHVAEKLIFNGTGESKASEQLWLKYSSGTAGQELLDDQHIKVIFSPSGSVVNDVKINSNGFVKVGLAPSGTKSFVVEFPVKNSPFVGSNKTMRLQAAFNQFEPGTHFAEGTGTILGETPLSLSDANAPVAGTLIFRGAVVNLVSATSLLMRYESGTAGLLVTGKKVKVTFLPSGNVVEGTISQLGMASIGGVPQGTTSFEVAVPVEDLPFTGTDRWMKLHVALASSSSQIVSARGTITPKGAPPPTSDLTLSDANAAVGESLFFSGHGESRAGDKLFLKFNAGTAGKSLLDSSHLKVTFYPSGKSINNVVVSDLAFSSSAGFVPEGTTSFEIAYPVKNTPFDGPDKTMKLQAAFNQFEPGTHFAEGTGTILGETPLSLSDANAPVAGTLIFRGAVVNLVSATSLLMRYESGTAGLLVTGKKVKVTFLPSGNVVEGTISQLGMASIGGVPQGTTSFEVAVPVEDLPFTGTDRWMKLHVALASSSSQIVSARGTITPKGAPPPTSDLTLSDANAAVGESLFFSGHGKSVSSDKLFLKFDAGTAGKSLLDSSHLEVTFYPSGKSINNVVVSDLAFSSSAGFVPEGTTGFEIAYPVKNTPFDGPDKTMKLQASYGKTAPSSGGLYAEGTGTISGEPSLPPAGGVVLSLGDAKAAVGDTLVFNGESQVNEDAYLWLKYTPGTAGKDLLDDQEIKVTFYPSGESVSHLSIGTDRLSEAGRIPTGTTRFDVEFPVNDLPFTGLDKTMQLHAAIGVEEPARPYEKTGVGTVSGQRVGLVLNDAKAAVSEKLIFKGIGKSKQYEKLYLKYAPGTAGTAGSGEGLLDDKHVVVTFFPSKVVRENVQIYSTLLAPGAGVIPKGTTSFEVAFPVVNKPFEGADKTMQLMAMYSEFNPGQTPAELVEATGGISGNAPLPPENIVLSLGDASAAVSESLIFHGTSEVKDGAEFWLKYIPDSAGLTLLDNQHINVTFQPSGKVIKDAVISNTRFSSLGIAPAGTTSFDVEFPVKNLPFDGPDKKMQLQAAINSDTPTTQFAQGTGTISGKGPLPPAGGVVLSLGDAKAAVGDTLVFNGESEVSEDSYLWLKYSPGTAGKDLLDDQNVSVIFNPSGESVNRLRINTDRLSEVGRIPAGTTSFDVEFPVNDLPFSGEDKKMRLQAAIGIEQPNRQDEKEGTGTISGKAVSGLVLNDAKAAVSEKLIFKGRGKSKPQQKLYLKYAAGTAGSKLLDDDHLEVTFFPSKEVRKDVGISSSFWMPAAGVMPEGTTSFEVAFPVMNEPFEGADKTMQLMAVYKTYIPGESEEVAKATGTISGKAPPENIVLSLGDAKAAVSESLVFHGTSKVKEGTEFWLKYTPDSAGQTLLDNQHINVTFQPSGKVLKDAVISTTRFSSLGIAPAGTTSFDVEFPVKNLPFDGPDKKMQLQAAINSDTPTTQFAQGIGTISGKAPPSNDVISLGDAKAAVADTLVFHGKSEVKQGSEFWLKYSLGTAESALLNDKRVKVTLYPSGAIFDNVSVGTTRFSTPGIAPAGTTSFDVEFPVNNLPFTGPDKTMQLQAAITMDAPTTAFKEGTGTISGQRGGLILNDAKAAVSEKLIFKGVGKSIPNEKLYLKYSAGTAGANLLDEKHVDVTFLPSKEVRKDVDISDSYLLAIGVIPEGTTSFEVAFPVMNKPFEGADKTMQLMAMYSEFAPGQNPAGLLKATGTISGKAPASNDVISLSDAKAAVSETLIFHGKNIETTSEKRLYLRYEPGTTGSGLLEDNNIKVTFYPSGKIQEKQMMLLGFFMPVDGGVPKGTTSFDIEVPVKDRPFDGPDQTMQLHVSLTSDSPQPVKFIKGTGTISGAVLEIDSVSDASAKEGESLESTVQLKFKTLPAGQKVYLKTKMLTATDDDLDLAHTRIRFPGSSVADQVVDLSGSQEVAVSVPVDSGKTLLVSVPVLEDDINELAETFELQVDALAGMKDAKRGMMTLLNKLVLPKLARLSVKAIGDSVVRAPLDYAAADVQIQYKVAVDVSNLPLPGKKMTREARVLALRDRALGSLSIVAKVDGHSQTDRNGEMMCSFAINEQSDRHALISSYFGYQKTGAAGGWQDFTQDCTAQPISLLSAQAFGDRVNSSGGSWKQEAMDPEAGTASYSLLTRLGFKMNDSSSAMDAEHHEQWQGEAKNSGNITVELTLDNAAP